MTDRKQRYVEASRNGEDEIPSYALPDYRVTSLPDGFALWELRVNAMPLT